MKQKIKCVHCKSNKHIRKGFRNTQNRGKIQKYKCLSCKKLFTNDDGFYRMRNNEKIITMSIDMYLSNLSSRKMRNQLKRHLETRISHVAILDWVRKYVLKVQKYVNTLTPELSGKFYSDETEIDRGGQNDVFWCNVDWETRYISATLYSPNPQNMKDAVEFMRRIKKSKAKPKYIQTDALAQYPKAFNRIFYNRKDTIETMVKHRVNNVSKTKKHNVRIETVFSKLKDRVYDFRGFKSLWSAPILMQGLILQHNFIEEHTTTGARPCKLAGINIGATDNKWLDLIKTSASSSA